MSAITPTDTKPNGPVAAAFIAAGVGCMTLGLIVVLNEAKVIPSATLDFAKNYGIGSGVGPLSGKVIISTIVFLAMWGVLGFIWRRKEVNFGRAITVAVVCLAIGFLLTFPPVFEIFAAD
ncbi:MAG TPA: hypothetical protein VFN41_09745 [Candidatus Limnocylindrales bacterium]|nr:hypothetical protein [Candidatus Limnocylindrales bacterium]